MPHSIEKIKSTLIGGGARPNLFQVDLTSFPGSGDTLDTIQIVFLFCVRQHSCLHQT